MTKGQVTRRELDKASALRVIKLHQLHLSENYILVTSRSPKCKRLCKKQTTGFLSYCSLKCLIVQVRKWKTKQWQWIIARRRWSTTMEKSMRGNIPILETTRRTVWTSMYEKNLGRKVSRLPPWEVSQTGRKESSERHFGDPTKRDFASIHLERAASTGSLGLKKHPPREKKTSKKPRSGIDSSKGLDKERKSKEGKEEKSSQSSSEQDK